MKTISDISTISENGIVPETYLPSAEKIVTGSPQQSLWNNYSSNDGKFHAGIWSSAAGEWQVSYSEDEYCHILEGESVITDANGESRTVKAGEHFMVPAGFHGTWKVPSYCKKIYVIYEA